jgi:hypothetical protein
MDTFTTDRRELPRAQLTVLERVLGVEEATKIMCTPLQLAYISATQQDYDQFKIYQNQIPHLHIQLMDIAAEHDDLATMVWLLNIIKFSQEDCRPIYKKVVAMGKENPSKLLKEFFGFV